MNMAQAQNPIAARYGSIRGAMRLALSYPQSRFLNLERPPVNDTDVRRFVFVCRGNISRSAFAEGLATRAGYAVASFGLDACSGQPADPVAIRIAEEFGIDLTQHRSTEAGDFTGQSGDLFLAMEVRQMTQIAANNALQNTSRLLLGQYCGTPHLHDPFTLSPAYYRHCFARIKTAVDHLTLLYPTARLCEK